MELLQALEPPQADAVTSAVSTLREVDFIPLDSSVHMHLSISVLMLFAICYACSENAKT